MQSKEDVKLTKANTNDNYSLTNKAKIIKKANYIEIELNGELYIPKLGILNEINGNTQSNPKILDSTRDTTLKANSLNAKEIKSSELNDNQIKYNISKKRNVEIQTSGSFLDSYVCIGEFELGLFVEIDLKNQNNLLINELCLFFDKPIDLFKLPAKLYAIKKANKYMTAVFFDIVHKLKILKIISFNYLDSLLGSDLMSKLKIMMYNLNYDAILVDAPNKLVEFYQGNQFQTCSKSYLEYLCKFIENENNNFMFFGKMDKKIWSNTYLIQCNIDVLKEFINNVFLHIEKQDFEDEILKNNLDFMKNKKQWSEYLPTFWQGKTSLECMVGDAEMDTIDTEGTKYIIDYLSSHQIINIKEDYILEVAAGIGRVTHILCQRFTKIDVLEPYNAKEIRILKETNSQIKKIYEATAEKFEFSKKYNVLFGSWLFGNLTDIDAVIFLIKCQKNIEANGIFIIKENINSHTLHSKSDLKQRIRTIKSYEIIFKLAGFGIIYQEKTKNWPERCYDLVVFVIKAI